MTVVLHFITHTLLPFIFVLGLLIFVHELGHFLAAKLAGIRVERFSLGFPPRIIGKKIGDTDYCISAIPFGGYVKMAGMIDESLDKDGIKGEPDEFMSKPILARMGVMVAGPGMNYLLAVIIFAGIILFTGIAEPVGSVVGGVIPGEPAEEIGLQPGDRIVSLNGESVDSWDELVRTIHPNKGNKVILTYERNDELFSATVVPRYDKIQGVGLIGIVPETSIRPAGLFEAIGKAFSMTWDKTKMVGRFLKMLLLREVSVREGVAGPIGIGVIITEATKAGFGSLLWIAAFLSLNLSLINILPIPVLDGGHIVFLGIEAIKRKPLSIKTRLVIQQVGMAFLLALMVFFIFNDIARFF